MSVQGISTHAVVPHFSREELLKRVSLSGPAPMMQEIAPAPVIEETNWAELDKDHSAPEPVIESQLVVPEPVAPAVKTPYDGALIMQAHGSLLIPLLPKSKIAFQNNWQDTATNDLGLIQQQHAAHPDSNWACVAKAVIGGQWFFEIDNKDILKQILADTGHDLMKECQTFKASSSIGRAHLYFLQTEASIAMGNCQGKIDGREAWSARTSDRYVVCALSWHPTSGRQYEIRKDVPLTAAPIWLIEWCLGQRTKTDAKIDLKDEAPIIEGSRNNALTSILGKFRQTMGADRDQLLEFGLSVNQKRCNPPLSDNEVKTIAYSVARYDVVPTGPETVKMGSYDRAKAEATAPSLEEKAKTMQAASNQLISDAVKKATFDPAAARQDRLYDYEGLVVTGAYCLWLGDRKAEKSLFALRKAMHDACGKDWLNYRNLRGPLSVLYFDSENDGAEVWERYNEIIQEFNAGEQELIRKNVHLVIGKTIKKERVDFEVHNEDFWKFLRKEHSGIRVVYLDCWYQLQSIKAQDNETQKLALEKFEDYFPDTTIFLLHHTGRENQESLTKKNPPSLRAIGPERWSSKSAGGNVLTKKMDLIFCQQRYERRDGENVVVESCIDFQVYSRSDEGSGLLSFEAVLGEEIDGETKDYKYRRNMILRLSTQAAVLVSKLRNMGQPKGPWKTRFAIVKDAQLGIGGNQYIYIKELIAKGFIRQRPEDGLYWLQDDERLKDAIEASADNLEAGKSAARLLDELLAMPEGCPYELIKSRAELDGINLTAVRQLKTRQKIRSVVKENRIWWVK